MGVCFSNGFCEGFQNGMHTNRVMKGTVCSLSYFQKSLIVIVTLWNINVVL